MKMMATMTLSGVKYCPFFLLRLLLRLGLQSSKPRRTPAYSLTTSPSTVWEKIPLFQLFTTALLCATIISPATATTYLCPDNTWTAGSADTSVPYRCYKRLTGGWTWNQANTICASQASGASLAEFQSQSEVDVAKSLCLPLSNFVSDWCWTGIYADPGPNSRTCCWKYIDGGDPTWLRSNGGTIWASSEPNNASGDEYCTAFGYLSDGMIDTQCNVGSGAICSVLAMEPSPSPSNSPSSSPSATASPTLSPSASSSSSRSPSSTVSRSPSASSTVSRTPSGSPTVSPSPSASPTVTPSPSNVPVLTEVRNVTAVIDNQLPTISISAPTTTAGENSTVGVTSSFQNIQVGSNTPATLEASDVTVRVEDRPASADSGSNATVTTHIYTSVLPGTTNTTFEQSFAFHNQSAQGQFAQVGFTIGASTLKWSINVTGGSSDQLTVRYRLATLGSSAADAIDSSQPVVVRPNLPHTNMTTYFFSLRSTSSSSSSSSSRITAKVEAFDVALVDGDTVPLVSHSVVLVNGSALAQPEYVLELSFPAFAHSLFYDPSISMGVLVNTRGDKSSSSDNSSLVIAVAVVVPLALVAVVIAAASVTIWSRVHRSRIRERVRQQTLAFNMTTLH